VLPVYDLSRKTRVLTMSALISALAVLTLYFASVWPTGRIGLVALASVFTAAAVVEGGVRPGIGVYVVSSVIALLLVPERSTTLLYIVFFGYYPILKSLFERVRGTALQWLLKLLVLNAALTVIWFFLRALIFDFGDETPLVALLYLGGNIVFALFDYGFSKLIWLYINRVSRRR